MMSRTGNKDEEGDKKPRVVAEQVRCYLQKLDAFRLGGPDGVLPSVLKGLPEVVSEQTEYPV